MKVGILGLGVMGSNHLRVLRDIIGVDSLVVFDPDASFANRSLHGVSKCRSLNEFLEAQESLDYCVIATPTSFHEENVLTLMKCGQNILVEKPLAANLEQGQRILSAVKNTNAVLSVGHIERFNSAIIEAKRKISEGIIGGIFQVQTVRQGPLPLRISDVGVLVDLASHDIDLVHHLTGDTYRYIFADLKFVTGRNFEDSMIVMGKTVNGISVLHNVNWLSPRKERSVTVFGDNGVLFIDCLRSELTFYENASVLIEDERLASFRGVSEGNAIRFAFPKKEALVSQHSGFIKHLKGERGQIVPLTEAFNALTVMDGILNSYRKNERVDLSYV